MSQYMAEIQGIDIKAVLEEHSKFVSMTAEGQSKLSAQLLKLEYQNEKFNMKVENIRLQDELNQTKYKYRTLCKIVEIAQNQRLSTQKEIEQLKSNVSRLGQQIKVKDREIQSLNQQMHQCQKKLLQKLQAATAQYRKQKKGWQAEQGQKQETNAMRVAKLQKQIIDNQTTINNLQQQLDKLKRKDIDNGIKNVQLMDVINSICKIVGVAIEECFDGQEIVSRVGYRVSWVLDQINDIDRYLLSKQKSNALKSVPIVERIQRITEKLVKQVQTLETNRNQIENSINNVLETYTVDYERCYGFELMETMSKKIKCLADETDDLRIRIKQANKQKQPIQKSKEMANKQKERREQKQNNLKRQQQSLIAQIETMSKSLMQSCRSEQQKKSQEEWHNEAKSKIKSMITQLKVKMEQNDYLTTQIEELKLDNKRLAVNKQYEANATGAEMQKLVSRLVKLVQAYCSPPEKWSSTSQDAFKYLQLRLQKLNNHRTLFQKPCLSEQFASNLSWIEQLVINYSVSSSKFITQFMKVPINPIDFRQILSKKNTITICKSEKGALFGILIIEKVNKRRNQYIVAILSATKKIMYPKYNISTMTTVEVNQEGCLVVGRQSELVITKNLQLKMMSKQKGYFGVVSAKDVLNLSSASEIVKINQIQVYEIIYI